MDDSGHGDETGPAKPDEARPREPVSGSIPTVARHLPRSPVQLAPWPEETVAAVPAGNAQVEEQGSFDSSSEAPVPVVAPESPPSLLPVDAPDDVDRHEALAAEPSKVPAPSIAPEPKAQPTNASGDISSHEQHAAERASDAAAEVAMQEQLPALHQAAETESPSPNTFEPPSGTIVAPDVPGFLAAANEAASPEPTEAVVSDPVFEEPPIAPARALNDAPSAEIAEGGTSEPIVDERIHPSIAPVMHPDVDLENDAAIPVAIEPDIFTGRPSELADKQFIQAEFLAPPVSASLDAEAPSIASMPLDPAPPDERPAPIREEQIWSGPEVVEPSLRWLEPEHADARPEPPADTGARAEPVSPADQHRPAAALDAAAPGTGAHAEPALSAVQHTPSTALIAAAPIVPTPLSAASWPSTSLPSPGGVRDALPRLRLALRVAGVVVLTLSAAVLLLVVLYRWVDPPTSTLMLGQRLTGTEIEQKWVPIERISPHLVQAVILSEDGAFCRHRGVDWSALEEAIESSRGGSTITMQVVKNLFLWPARSYVRKALEIMLAYVVEVVWPKERVLEIYLNIAEWGPGLFGAEAAARTHFGKTASKLTAQEAAQLAVSLPNPIDRQAGYPDWQTRRLANNLLLRMRAVRTAQRCVRPRRGGS